jgi:hypothetical protein
LREVIAKAVKSDKEQYSEVFLGKPTEEYAKWILTPESWGGKIIIMMMITRSIMSSYLFLLGAIELSILSKYYKCEIAAFDIQTTKMYVYGEGQNYKKRVFILYGKPTNHYLVRTNYPLKMVFTMMQWLLPLIKLHLKRWM